MIKLLVTHQWTERPSRVKPHLLNGFLLFRCSHSRTRYFRSLVATSVASWQPGNESMCTIQGATRLASSSTSSWEYLSNGANTIYILSMNSPLSEKKKWNVLKFIGTSREIFTKHGRAFTLNSLRVYLVCLDILATPTAANVHVHDSNLSLSADCNLSESSSSFTWWRYNNQLGSSPLWNIRMGNYLLSRFTAY